ncbi:MAG TPA: hypothetical protein VNT51_10635 [Miltoncostaeaceae bacterium]|nr:hypothetical protein [Miltoncostaeaceae bacterium]
MTRRLPAPALAALVLALAAPPVLAQDPAGRLYADGSGAVTLEGDVLAYGVGMGPPVTLRVVDRTGDARVMVAGVLLEPRRTRRTLEYRVRTGERFMVSGGRVSIEVRGDRLSISAAGVGMARLRGRGRYVLNDVTGPRWHGRTLRVAAPAPGEAATRDRGRARAAGRTGPPDHLRARAAGRR